MDHYFPIDYHNPMPLYAQLSQAIKEEIRSGRIAYGEKLPSENELSEQCRLSRMTVRNALADLVNERYVEKVHGKGTYVCYKPSSSHVGSIDVLLDVTYSYFSMLYIKSISEVLTQNSYQFVIHDTHDSQQDICTILEQILAKGSAGVILQPHHIVEPTLPQLRDVLGRMRAKGIPYVLLDRSLEGIPGATMVFDDYAGAGLAAEHLLSFGHKRCAMVTSSRYCENQPRLSGFNAVLEANHLPPLELVEDGAEAEKKLLSLVREKHVTAVFNYNDEVALRTMRILQNAGLRIPEDVSVMGFDDTIITMATNPQLTSVVHPKDTLGRLSAEMLLGMIEKSEPERTDLQLRPKLHIQASCGAAPK